MTSSFPQPHRAFYWAQEVFSQVPWNPERDQNQSLNSGMLKVVSFKHVIKIYLLSEFVMASSMNELFI